MGMKESCLPLYNPIRELVTRGETHNPDTTGEIKLSPSTVGQCREKGLKREKALPSARLALTLQDSWPAEVSGLRTRLQSAVRTLLLQENGGRAPVNVQTFENWSQSAIIW